MNTLRWVVGLTALALYAFMIVVLIIMANQGAKTGRFPSGLSFVPSIIASMGILILPTSTIGARAPFLLAPFAIESAYFWFTFAYDSQRKQSRK